MAGVRGGKEHVARLKRLSGPEMTKKLGAALYAAGNKIQVDAQISITTGAVSGKGHVPSRPGTPPNQDTGVLGNNIETAQIAPLKVQVSSNAPYAAIQEYGGTINHPGGTAFFIGSDGLAVFVPDSNILSSYLPRTKPHKITLPERPYMRPAVEKNRKLITEKLKDQVNIIVGRRA